MCRKILYFIAEKEISSKSRLMKFRLTMDKIAGDERRGRIEG